MRLAHNSAFVRFFPRNERRYLFSPLIDAALAGGIAWAVIPLLFWLAPPTAAGKVDGYLTFHVSVAFAVLAYVVNYPHFMASYGLLYSGYRTRLRAYRAEGLFYWRYLFAGIGVPCLLLAYFAYAFITQRMAVFSIGVQLMFFTVGWHYVKQGFGVFILLSALKRVYYGRAIRRLLLINCLLVWMLSWLGGNIWVPGYEQSHTNFRGVIYAPLGIGLPPYVMGLLRLAVWGYGGMVLAAIGWQAWRTRTLPSLTALAGYSTMYTLLLLSYLHPLWVYMTPLLHSAQYLLFIAAYKRGETADSGREDSRADIKRYVVLLLWTGILAFTLFPRVLEWGTGGVTHGAGLFLPFFYAFTVFINVHHYFIDNVIWRKENRELHGYIGYSPPDVIKQSYISS